MTDKNIGFPRLRPLLTKAGIPESMHEEVVDGIAGFTTVMIQLMQDNEDVAPNYLTFAMGTPDGQRYELTLRECEGKTPVEVIDELETRIKELEKAREPTLTIRTDSEYHGLEIPGEPAISDWQSLRTEDNSCVQEITVCGHCAENLLAAHNKEPS